MDEMDLSNLTEEEIQQLMELGILPGELDDLKDQMYYGERASRTPTPKGQMVRDNIYVAANPLQHAAAGIKQGMGMRDMRQAREGADAARQKQAEGRGTFWKNYARSRTPKGPQMSPVPGYEEESNVDMILEKLRGL